MGKTYRNPIVQNGAGPFILYDNGTYYLYATTPVLWGYSVRTSPDLINWTDHGLCLTIEDACCEPTLQAGFWAPEVHRAGSRFAMVYSVNEHIGIAFADSPLGPFKPPVHRPPVPHRAIDSTLFTDENGQTYLFYVGWETVTYGIYGRTIDLETLELGPYTKYQHNPILHQATEKGIFGPGHHSFFTAANGETMITYHRHFSADSVHERTACIDRIRFCPDTPVDRLEILGPTDGNMPIPASLRSIP